LVDFVVDDQGQAQMVRAIKATTPEFGDAAVAAMMQWRFSPGQKDGRVVWTHLQMPIVFSATEP
jgi:TonB family protein